METEPKPGREPEPEPEPGPKPKPEPEPEPEPEQPTRPPTDSELFAIFGGSSSGDDDEAEDPTAGPDEPPSAAALWELVASREAGGGKGLRATADIKANAEIYRESPALRCPNGHAATSFEEGLAKHKQCILERFERLPDDSRHELMRLFSLAKYNDVEGKATIFGVFQTNAIRLTGMDSNDGGVFVVQCRMNHSCRPNVLPVWRPNSQKQVLFATRDIACGEEMYTSYGFGDEETTAGRREHLQREFGFHCRCELCVQSDG